MRRSLVAVATAAMLAVAGCSGSGANGTSEAPPASSAAGIAHDGEAVLASLGFAGKSAKEIVQAIDSSDDARPLAFGASVRGSELILSADAGETKLALPSDLFYVSVAPYRDQTHECYFHSLATCRGELAKQDVSVTITDTAGTVLAKETRKTYANGFVGFWLPKDVEGTITVEHDGDTGSVDFATTDGSPTCITTLRLA